MCFWGVELRSALMATDLIDYLPEAFCEHALARWDSLQWLLGTEVSDQVEVHDRGTTLLKHIR